MRKSMIPAGHTPIVIVEVRSGRPVIVGHRYVPTPRISKENKA